MTAVCDVTACPQDFDTTRGVDSPDGASVRREANRSSSGVGALAARPSRAELPASPMGALRWDGGIAAAGRERSRFGKLLLAGAAVAALAASTACRVDTDVDVTVNGDGSGVVAVAVTADDDAAAAVPELLSGPIVADIAESGWTSPVVEPLADGGVLIEASKEFDSAEQLQAVLDEIAGPGVFFDDVELEQSSSFARTRWDFSAAIDPSPPLKAFSDEGLAAALDGEFLGRPLADPVAGVIPPTASEAAEAEAESDGSEEAEAESPQFFFGLNFYLTLPADISEPAPENIGAGPSDTAASIPAKSLSTISGSTASWHFFYGEEPATVSASATADYSTPKMLLTVSRGAAAAFGLLLVLWAASRFLAVMRTPKGHRKRAARHRRKRAATRRAAESRQKKPPQRLLRLLVVDVHGVLVRPSSPFENLLLPTIRGELPDIDPALVRDRYRKLVLGRLMPEEFWSDLGLGPIGMSLETRYLSSFRLVPGLHTFFESVAAQKLPVVAVGNQPRQWGDRLRRMAQLENLTELWLTSGEVGAALPQPPLLEAARRKISIDAYDCLYLSSVPAFLDVGKDLGMSTAYFAASPKDAPVTSHPVVRGFADILQSKNIVS